MVLFDGLHAEVEASFACSPPKSADFAQKTYSLVDIDLKAATASSLARIRSRASSVSTSGVHAMP